MVFRSRCRCPSKEAPGAAGSTAVAVYRGLVLMARLSHRGEHNAGREKSGFVSLHHVSSTITFGPFPIVTTVQAM